MEGVSAQSLWFVLGLMTSGVAFIGLVFGLNKLLSPRNPTPEKLEPYECGMEPAGPPRAAVNLRFATVAILLVLFDAEAALLFAIAPALRGNPIALLEVLAFTGALALGLAYAWKKGALEWR